MKIFVTEFQRGPCMKIVISFAAINEDETAATKHININNLAEVRFKFKHLKDTSGHITHSISWKKHESVLSILNNKVDIYITCEQLKYSEQFICKKNWSEWINMGKLTRRDTQETGRMNASRVTLTVSQVKTITFPNLYLETEFCDFYLKTVDSKASVPVHKACISLHSDVFKRMLQGEWKENENGCIEIVGVTLQTLQDLKLYIYNGILPNYRLQLLPLLLLAKCYMINNLMTECIMRLVITVKPEDLYSLQEFAVDNKIPELIRVIVQVVSDETVQMAHEMEKDKLLLQHAIV